MWHPGAVSLKVERLNLKVKEWLCMHMQKVQSIFATTIVKVVKQIAQQIDFSFLLKRIG